MTDCENAVQTFSALLDGELRDEEADALDRHLAGCEACRKEARRLAVLNRLSVEIVLRDRKARPAAPKRTTRRSAPPPPTWRPVWFVAAAAAAAVLAVVLYSARGEKPAPAMPEVRKHEEPRTIVEAPRPREPERPPEPRPVPPERREELRPEPVPAPEKSVPEVKREPEKPKEEPPKPEEGIKPRTDPSPRPSETRTTVAKLPTVAGEVFLTTEAGRAAATAGQALLSGMVVETGASLSWASVTFEDGTRMDLAAGTKVTITVGDDGKRVTVQQGMVSADVARQPVGKPMLFVSAHGEAKVLGTSLRIVVDPDAAKGSTRVDVEEGKVQVKRLLDGKMVDVPSGHYAIAAPGSELKTLTLPVVRRKRSPNVDARAVDDAIWRGVASLREPMAFDHWDLAGRERMKDFYEITLWALIEAGVPERDPLFEGLLLRITTMPFKTTYHTALQAMILEQVHRVKYQVRIAECAQYLVDNQMKNGQWDLGEPTDLTHKEWTAPSNVKEFNPFLPVNQREKPAVSRRLAVTKRREGRRPDGRPFGDNVQSFWAALGLRACVDAGINVDAEVLRKGAKWWRDGSFSTGDPAAPGWGDQGKGQGEPNGYVTAGAAEALLFYDRVLGVDWTKDKAILGALKWLQANWTVTEVPKAQDPAVKSKLYEYLWAVERVAGLCGVEKFDTQDWYADGVKFFLVNQEQTGSWARGEPHPTSLAVIFLKRGTRSLAEISADRR